MHKNKKPIHIGEMTPTNISISFILFISAIYKRVIVIIILINN